VPAFSHRASVSNIRAISIHAAELGLPGHPIERLQASSGG